MIVTHLIIFFFPTSFLAANVELPSSQESGRGFTLRVGSRSASSGGDVVILHTRVHHQSENHKWPKATSDFHSDMHEWCVKLLLHDCIIEVLITSGRRPQVINTSICRSGVVALHIRLKLAL